MTPHGRLVSSILITAALAASGCNVAIGPAPPVAAGPALDQSRVADVAACRERADQVFQRQNREHVYRVDTYNTDTRDSPFATSGVKGVTSANLPQQFARDTMVQNCLGGSGAAAAPTSRDLQTTGPVTP